MKQMYKLFILFFLFIFDGLHHASSNLVYQISSEFALSFLPLLFLPINLNKTAKESVLFMKSPFHYSEKRPYSTSNSYGDKPAEGVSSVDSFRPSGDRGPVKVYDNVASQKIEIFKYNNKR